MMMMTIFLYKYTYVHNCVYVYISLFVTAVAFCCKKSFMGRSHMRHSNCPKRIMVVRYWLAVVCALYYHCDWKGFHNWPIVFIKIFVFTIYRSTGEFKQELTLPDTITEWVGKAVCVHPTAGLGLSPSTSIVTFTPFFVDLTVLPSIKKGEIMPIVVSVFNYQDQSIPVGIRRCLMFLHIWFYNVFEQQASCIWIILMSI